MCQLFQIHSSKFKPDPSGNCSQASVVCITHCVFLLHVRKDTLYRLFALRVKPLAMLGLADALHKIHVFLPDVGCVYLLPLLIRAAFRLAGTVFTILRGAAVGTLSVLVGDRVSQYSALRAGIGIICGIVGVFPRFISVLLSVVSCIGKNGHLPVIQRLLAIHGVL